MLERAVLLQSFTNELWRKVNGGRKRGTRMFGRTTIQHLPQPAAVEFAEHGIEFAVRIVTLDRRCIGKCLVKNLQPIMTNPPANSKDGDDAIPATSYDIELRPFGGDRAVLSREQRIPVNSLFIAHLRITEKLQHIDYQGSKSVTN